MSQRFQATALVASPCYPNALAWSDENLIAVASGHLVTILNPASLFGPRGLITLSPSKPFPIGVIEREELLSPCLLPNCLSREVRPCVRSISWSPIGLAPNAGCLLAVCTTEGRVKLYRMPFCEYSPEWVETADISERLFSYLSSVNFDESRVLSSRIPEEQRSEAQLNQSGAVDQQNSVMKTERKRRGQKTLKVAKDGNLKENDLHHIIAMPDSRGKPSKVVSERFILPSITAEQYASRSDMLSSLIVVWSPIVKLTARVEEACSNDMSSSFSVLAVGGKSGRIYFWRSFEQECYSTMDGRESCTVSLIGFLQAHDCWVTAVSWSLFVSDASNPQLLLATGSSNGSVKIWQAYGKELVKSSETHHASFFLLKEVVSIDSSTISVLSLVVPKKSEGRMLLATGRGSGTLEVWICDIHSSKFEKAGCSSTQQHIVTGLAWAFGGKCLYSCSQDDRFVHSWILHGNSLSEVPIPSNTPGLRSSFDVPNVYDLCFGLAVSPGNLVIAVAHSFDTGLLNPMYQERTQKAAVEFLWTGGQQLDLIFDINPDFNVEAFPGLPEKELILWEANILWSLNQYQHMDKPLVLWDVIAALSAFKQSVPDYVEHILLKWLRLCFGTQFDVSPTILSKLSKFRASIASRELHILNVISRHVVLKELNTDQINGKGKDFEGLSGPQDKENLWLKLLSDSEKELRERLLYLNFIAALRLVSYSSTEFGKLGCWNPIGLGQMMQWVARNTDDLKNHLKFLVLEVGKIEKRLHSLCEYRVEERCSFCSALVPFESAEVAFCQGLETDVGVGHRHKLLRCMVSMLVVPVNPSWFCISCKRWASYLKPPNLFSMTKYPSDLNYTPESSLSQSSSKPLCPFCGILLQRQQPEFLLSLSPV